MLSGGICHSGGRQGRNERERKDTQIIPPCQRNINVE